MISRLIGIMLILCFSQQVYAHALWIETNPAGIKGKPQEVKIYFGEYSNNDITLAAKWFSDLKDFSLLVIGPDKKETRLSATPRGNYYSAQSCCGPFSRRQTIMPY